MGIPKLTGFITHNFQAWQSMIVRGDLVIDGSSLCYNLYFQHYKWELGGEYCEFYGTVRQYFKELNSLSIQAYVVMDGMDFDDSKKVSQDKRCQQKIERISAMQSGRGESRTVQFSLIPLFAKSVFLDAARECGVSCFVADGEADQSIVSLANHLHCPVLGNDSDFFIFNIDCGYIPITGTDKNGCLVDLKSAVNYFQAKDFDRQFSLSPEQRVFLPLVLGNDICSGCSFPGLRIDSSTAVHKIITGVKRNLRTEVDVRRIGGDHAFHQLSQIRAYYTVESQSFKDLSSSRSLSALYHSTPRWILDLYKRGMFSANVLHLMLSPHKIWRYLVVVEDMRQPSAWKAAERLLLYIIGAVLGEQGRGVQLTDRDALKLVEKGVKLVDEHLQFPSLAAIPQMQVADRQDIVINIFQCQGISADIKSTAVQNKLKITILASRFWLKVDGSNNDWLEALVSSILACSRSDPPPRDDRCLLRGEEKLRFIHAFAQWQCILHDAIALNQVLKCPFPEAVSSPRLFSSVAVQHYYRNLPRRSKEAELLIKLITREYSA